MKKIFKLFNKRKGFTLIEILLVVGFIAVAGIGVYVVYGKVTMSNAANNETRNIDVLRSGIKNLFAGTQSTAGLNNTVVNNAGITPSSMQTAGSPGVITNAFGGAVDVSALTITNPNDGFRINYPNVPGVVCTKLVTGTGSQFDRVFINNNIVKAFGVNTPVNIEATATQCAMDTGNGVTIQFDSLK